MTYRGELTLVVRGTDNRLYINQASAETSNWSGWSQIAGDGATNGNPTATVSQGRFYVVVQGTDNNIYWNECR